MIPLDIFADPVCPWCLIGKAELDRALESRPSHPFQIAWHPFRLNPGMPRGGADRIAPYAAAPPHGEQVIGVVLLSDLERALQAHAGAQGRDLRTT